MLFIEAARSPRALTLSGHGAREAQQRPPKTKVSMRPFGSPQQWHGETMDGMTWRTCSLLPPFNRALETPPGSKGNTAPGDDRDFQGDYTQHHVNQQLLCEKNYFHSFNFLMNFSMCSSPRKKKKKFDEKNPFQQPDILTKPGLLREPNAGASCKQTLPFSSPPHKISVFLDQALFTSAVPKSQGRLCASWRKARLLETTLAPK